MKDFSKNRFVLKCTDYQVLSKNGKNLINLVYNIKIKLQ